MNSVHFVIPDLILNINGHQKWNTCCSTCLYNSVLTELCDLCPSDQNCPNFWGRWHVKLEQNQLNVICSGDLLLLALWCFFFFFFPLCILEKLFYCLNKGWSLLCVSVLKVNPAHFVIPAAEMIGGIPHINLASLSKYIKMCIFQTSLSLN